MYLVARPRLHELLGVTWLSSNIVSLLSGNNFWLVELQRGQAQARVHLAVLPVLSVLILDSKVHSYDEAVNLLAYLINDKHLF